MAELAAPMLRPFMRGVPDALLVVPSPEGFRLTRRQKGRLQPLPAAVLDDERLRRGLQDRRRGEALAMTLPEPLLLREAALPSAAEANLDRVLRYEMDRLTPFTTDQVYFTHRVLSHDRARGLLRVELALALKARVQPWLDALSPFGAVPLSLEGVGPDGRARTISLLDPDPAGATRARMVSRLGAIICAALALATIIYPVVRQSMALDDANTRIAALRPRVNEVEALRRRLLSGAAGAGQITVARERAALAVQALGTLTDALPDDTWLTSLTLRQTRLVLEGRAAAASKLIAVLAAEPRLKDPAFAAPVVRADNGTDIFTIQAGFGS